MERDLLHPDYEHEEAGVAESVQVLWELSDIVASEV